MRKIVNDEHYDQNMYYRFDSISEMIDELILRQSEPNPKKYHLDMLKKLIRHHAVCFEQITESYNNDEAGYWVNEYE